MVSGVFVCADRLPVFCRYCKSEIILNIRGQSVERQSP